MQIDSSGLRDLYQQTIALDAKELYKSSWWLGKPRHQEAVEEIQTSPAITDPKAARAFALYARRRTRFAWGNLSLYLVLIPWLAHNQINKNMKRIFDLLMALSSLPFI